MLASAIALGLVFCLAASPSMNAPDVVNARDNVKREPANLVENLFQAAGELLTSLHQRPFEARTSSEYLHAIDAYGQVIRFGAEPNLASDSVYKIAELKLELASASGDYGLYQQAVDTFRKVTSSYPASSLVGNALVSIAQIYEETFQDLTGAADAYQQIVDHFPNSVMAREARAVLARLDRQMARAGNVADVMTSPPSEAAEVGRASLSNIRNFSGPDYARVVLDLSGEARFSAQRTGGNRLVVDLSGASIGRQLYGRRFIIGESTLLKHITVSALSNNVRVEIEVDKLAEYSTFLLPDPDRLVVDLRSTAQPKEHALPERRAVEARRTPDHSGTGAHERGMTKNRVFMGTPIFSLPRIDDPIVVASTESESNARGQGTSKEEAVSASKPQPQSAPHHGVKLIVIDPGHGGHDTGTIGSNGLQEKDLVLDVARRLKAYIKRSHPEIDVMLTRDSDRFIALEERTAIANSRHADLFISIHANASPSRAASGVETFFVTPDRAAKADQHNGARPAVATAADGNAASQVATAGVQSGASGSDNKQQPVVTTTVSAGNRVNESRDLARYIQAGLVRGVGSQAQNTAANRGVKHAPFAVLLGSAMPSVLAEVSFVSNPRDEAMLQTGQFREKIAASLYAGLNAFLKKNAPSESSVKK